MLVNSDDDNGTRAYFETDANVPEEANEAWVNSDANKTNDTEEAIHADGVEDPSLLATADTDTGSAVDTGTGIGTNIGADDDTCTDTSADFDAIADLADTEDTNNADRDSDDTL
jgi:hypothetical protein